VPTQIDGDRKRDRQQFLRVLYVLAHGSSEVVFDAAEVGRAAQLAPGDAIDAYDWLYDNRLVAKAGHNGETNLTRAGVLRARELFGPAR
jgi:hypothetical protein